MRALPIVSAFVLIVSALAACSAQQDGSPPAGNAGATTSGGGATGSAGAPISTGGSTTGTAGANTGFGGANTGFGGANTGFGGANTSGGATGSAGGTTTTAGCAMTKVGTGTPSGMIDDFETHPATALIPATDGRVGGWWISVNQTTGNVTIPAIGKTGTGPLPVTGGMGGGMALHFAGTDTDKTMGWGADASVALAATGNCYDASAYSTGIKLSLMGKPGSVYVQVITAQDKAAMATSGNQRVEIPITATWTDNSITWAQLMTGWGNPIVLDPKSIIALDIAPSAASAADFDIWVDNIQFVK